MQEAKLHEQLQQMCIHTGASTVCEASCGAWSPGPALFTGFKTASSGREVAEPPVLDSESCGTSTNGAPASRQSKHQTA